VEFLEVDGSQGEGGGQILRTAVSFSSIMRKPVRIVNIRAGRDVPGLKRQHVSALEVLSKVFGGELQGAAVGSSAVTFVPGAPKLSALSIDMGTAASITLVLQAVVPAVALSGSRLSLDLVGGTDVPWSPTFDYLQHVVREAYGSIGIRFELDAKRRGYYPRGGGVVSARVEPSGGVLPLDLSARPRVPGAMLLSRCGRLPRHVAERQLASAAASLEESGIPVLVSAQSEEQADSPGSSVLAYFTGNGGFLGADAIGERGKPAEEVGKDAGVRFASAAKSGAAVDPNLADMIIPLLSMAPGGSRVRVPDVTEHLKSGLHLAAQFTSCKWSITEEGRTKVVEIAPGQTR
jgi:RNA 3'-terminal phosphate cyclase (ATP)